MIGIITPGNKKYTPYIQNYLSILDGHNIDYRVMSWDKNNLAEDGVDMRFDYPVKDSNRKKMLFGYFRFIRKCKQFIKKNQIDKLIILTAAPVFFMGEMFLQRFRGRFIIDIRDDSPLICKFPKYFKKLCGYAESVIVSSNEFTVWTNRDTILCHNVDMELLQLHKSDSAADSFNTPIRIVFAGVMIEGACNVEVLKAFQSDARFEHVYIGRESKGKQLIRDYVNNSGLQNVSFEGTYKKDEIINIYRNKADIINIFRARTTVNRNALPNKLYEAVLSGIPVVVFAHNVAIATYVEKYNLGIVIPEKVNCALNDFILERARTFDFIKYKQGRESFLNLVENDMDYFSQIITCFLIA